MGTGISEASKRVPSFSFATQGGKQVSSYFWQRNWVQARETQIRSLQADLSLIVWRNSPARVSAQAPRFFVIYDSQFPLASSRFGRDSIQYRVGKTPCQGHQNPSKRVPIFLRGIEANLKMVPIWPVPISRSRTVQCTRSNARTRRCIQQPRESAQ